MFHSNFPICSDNLLLIMTVKPLVSPKDLVVWMSTFSYDRWTTQPSTGASRHRRRRFMLFEIQAILRIAPPIRISSVTISQITNHMRSSFRSVSSSFPPELIRFLSAVFTLGQFIRVRSQHGSISKA